MLNDKLLCEAVEHLVRDGRLGVFDVELLEESGVAGPEQSDVGNAVEFHRESLESETKRPADLVGHAGWPEANKRITRSRSSGLQLDGSSST